MEALKLWKNRKLIFEGLKNNIFKTDSVEAIAQDRLSICATCPHIDVEGTLCEVPMTQPCCGLCGCSLALKTRSLAAECDDKKWKAILTDDEQEEVYNKIGFNPTE